MQILWSHLRLIESVTLGSGAREFLLTVLPGDSNVHKGLKNHCSSTHLKRVNKQYKQILDLLKKKYTGFLGN